MINRRPYDRYFPDLLRRNDLLTPFLGAPQLPVCTVLGPCSFPPDPWSSGVSPRAGWGGSRGGCGWPGLAGRQGGGGGGLRGGCS